MNLIKKLGKLFGGTNTGDRNAYWIHARCNQCGEVLHARVDLRNELSIDYGEQDGEVTYFCRKTLIGSNRCFRPVEVTLRFNQHRQLIEQTITGGEFIPQGESHSTG